MPDINLAPYDVQAQQLARKRQLAQALQQQSMEPLQDPGYAGAKISPVQGFAKLAQALIAAYQNKKIDQQQTALSKEAQGSKGNMLSNMAKALMPVSAQPQGQIPMGQPSPLIDQLPPDAQGGMDAQGMAPVPQQLPQDLPQAPPPNAMPAVSANAQDVLSQVQGQQQKQKALASALASNTPEGQMMGQQMIGQYNKQQDIALADKDKREQMKQAEEAAKQNRMMELLKPITTPAGGVTSNSMGQVLVDNRKPETPVKDVRPFGEHQDGLFNNTTGEIVRQPADAQWAFTSEFVNVDGKEQRVLVGKDGSMLDASTRKPVVGKVTKLPPNTSGSDETQNRLVRKEALGIYQPALDSAERLNVMTQNLKDAVDNHDQQAMLSLLANHLGMTMGLAKGARINQAMVNEAMASRPWMQGMAAKFDKDGYLTGVTLTPQQMQQMVQLGQGRFSQDLQKSKSAAQYVGIMDGGPERIPARATIEYYLRANGNDLNKAKAAAEADGWTIK